jgi:hypothetical protein
MRVPNSVHEAGSWAIKQIAADFALLDAWALPVYGGREDFDAFLEGLASFDPAHAGSRATRALFAVRLFLGRIFGWDDPGKQRSIPGARENTLRERLPERLRTTAGSLDGPMERIAGGFVPLYRTDDEWAAEVANDTVHGVLHLAWVPQGDGRYQAHMAVYVKPRGVLGRLYMRLIQPFRHLIVYPALMRAIGRAWETR